MHNNHHGINIHGEFIMSTMAVTPEDYIFFDFLINRAFVHYTSDQVQLIRSLVDCGVVQIESLLEVALANSSMGLYYRVAEYYRDFSDNSDAKKVVSCFRCNDRVRNQWTNSFQVRGLSSKTGLLRVMAYSKYADCFYYFAIPHHEYRGRDLIEIRLDRFIGNGPHYPRGIPCGKWAHYLVDSFEELAQFQSR